MGAACDALLAAVDVAAMPQFTLHAELGAQKCRRKLSDKFLGGVRVRAARRP